MQKIHSMLFPEHDPTDEEMKLSRRVLLIQGALAAVMYNLGTGNFLAGYLTEVGASASQIAQIFAIPQLGCVLQLLSPFLFDRKKYRKPWIILFCFIFRFSLGLPVLAPFLFTGRHERLLYIFELYSLSFLSAGFVTPALDQWVMQIGPKVRRGQYYAAKDIISVIANAAVAFVMGRQLDAHIAAGQAMRGYLIVYGFCMIGAVVDLILLLMQKERASKVPEKMSAAMLIAPLKEKLFRPILVYELIGYTASMFSSSFLSVYQLNVLGLSHTYITSVGIAASVIGMAGIWVWGKITDHSNWTTTVLGTKCVMTLALFGWWLMPKSFAVYGAAVLISMTAACGSASAIAGTNLIYNSTPEAGRTAYFGVMTALCSAVGYGSMQIGSALQRTLEPSMGGKSIAVLFAVSGFLSLADLVYGCRKLPRKPILYP